MELNEKIVVNGLEFILRNATLNDCAFIAETIVQSEMSGTNKCGMAFLYDLSIEELKKCLAEMLEEEIDGCEFSLSSFLVIEHNGRPIAAASAWTEGSNDSNLPSSIIKANLSAYHIPKDKIQTLKDRLPVVSDIQIDREEGTLQFEFGYVLPEFQGLFLRDTLVEYLIAREKKLHPDIKKAQYHVFLCNKTVLLLSKYDGYKETRRFVSKNPDTIKYFPSDTMILFEKNI